MELKTQDDAELSEELKATIIKYCEDNQYEVYANRCEVFSNKQLQLLLDGDFEKFDDEVVHIENSLYDYVDWDWWNEGLCAHLKVDELTEKMLEIAQDHRGVDTSGYIETLLQNSSHQTYVAGYLTKASGGNIWGDGDDRDYLLKTFGFDQTETCNGYLCALGKLDFKDIYNKQQAPTHIEISRYDNLIFHQPSSGSGSSEFEIYARDERRWVFKCDFYVDGRFGYGVQETFGFSPEMWGADLNYLFKAKRGKR